MRINRYKWTPQGMIYHPDGDYVSAAAHLAVVDFAEGQHAEVVVTADTRASSLEAAVSDREEALDAARRQIEDLEKSLPASPMTEVKP